MHVSSWQQIAVEQPESGHVMASEDMGTQPSVQSVRVSQTGVQQTSSEHSPSGQLMEVEFEFNVYQDEQMYPTQVTFWQHEEVEHPPLPHNGLPLGSVPRGQE